MPLTILAYEEQPITAKGLVSVFDENEDFNLAGVFACLDQAINAAKTLEPEIFLVGQPPGARSMAPILTRIREEGVQRPLVAWVTYLTDRESFRALQVGARGVVTRKHSVPDFLECLRTVAGGEIWLRTAETSTTPSTVGAFARLTVRERQIVELVREGCRNREIAERLAITPGTVKVHLSHIFEKTGIRNRIELTRWSRDLLSLDERETVNHDL